MENQNLVPYRKGEKWGYSNFNKKLVIDCLYDKAEPFLEERAVVQKNGLWGVINPKGEVICNHQYEDIDDFKNGLAAVKKSGKWGFINLDGKVQIPLIYDNVLPFSDGLAAVQLNGKFGFIDFSGKPITKIAYENCDSFSDGFALVKEGGFHGLIDKEGKEVVPCISCIPVEYSEGLAVVSLVNPDEDLNPTAQQIKDYEPGVLRGYVDKGVLVLKDKNGHTFDSESLMLAAQNHKCGYVNINREVAIDFKYDMAFPFHEGLACVCVDSKFGFIDKEGKWAIEATFEDAGDFHCGLAKVKKNGKWGYLDNNCEIVIDFIYDEAYDFHEGYAKIVRSQFGDEKVTPRHGIIDFRGNERYFSEKDYFLIPEEFKDKYEEDFAFLVHDMFSEGFIGIGFFWSDIFYIDSKGKRLNQKKYADGDPFKNGIANVEIRIETKSSVKKENDDVFEDVQNEIKYQIGYIDKKGTEYWED